MDGFEELCLIDTEEEPEKVRKAEDISYQPLKREPFGFLEKDPPNISTQIENNLLTSRTIYYFSIGDYKTAKNLASQFFVSIENDPSLGKSPLIQQYHDILCRCYLEMGDFETSRKHCHHVIEGCGHSDSNCWLILAILDFVLGDVGKGFKCLERAVAMRNTNPNMWLLYATVLSCFYQFRSEKIKTLSDQLSKCKIARRFQNNWFDVLEKPILKLSELYHEEEDVYFYILCSVNNAVKLSSSIYDQNTSKTYTEFSTSWGNDVSEILKDITSAVPQEYLSCFEKNYRVIHYENWDDADFSKVDFLESFVRCSLPDSLSKK